MVAVMDTEPTTSNLVKAKETFYAHRTAFEAENYFRNFRLRNCSPPMADFVKKDEPLLIVKYVADVQLGSAYNTSIPRFCLYQVFNVRGQMGFIEKNLVGEEAKNPMIGLGELL